MTNDDDEWVLCGFQNKHKTSHLYPLTAIRRIPDTYDTSSNLIKLSFFILGYQTEPTFGKNNKTITKF